MNELHACQIKLVFAIFVGNKALEEKMILLSEGVTLIHSLPWIPINDCLNKVTLIQQNINTVRVELKVIEHRY